MFLKVYCFLEVYLVGFSFLFYIINSTPLNAKTVQTVISCHTWLYI